MPDDPRTLEPVKEAIDCHLIPDAFGVSGRTVSGERSIDNGIGRYCDSNLKTYFEYVLGDKVPFTVAMAGGAKSLRGEYDIPTKNLELFPGGKIDPAIVESRVLGAVGGKVTVVGGKGPEADGHYAAVSAIHSAFLILHALGRPEVFEPWMQQYRDVMGAASQGTLTEEQRDLVQSMVDLYIEAPDDVDEASDGTENAATETAGLGGAVPFKIEHGRVVLAHDKMFSIKCFGDPGAEAINAIRAQYDSEFDPGDGVLANFPNKSVTETAGYIDVVVPYSKSLRVAVRFLKPQSGIASGTSLPLKPLVDGLADPPGEELTHEEHDEARRRAYFLALDRGGGQIPTYDLQKVEEDFCRAAGFVKAMRPSSENDTS